MKNIRQTTLFDASTDESSQWPEDYILVSISPKYYYDLAIAKTKKYEYRRGPFFNGSATAFVYATTGKGKENIGFPSAEIGAVIRLGSPIIGIEEVIAIKESEDPGSESMMREWLNNSKTASAYPVEVVHLFKKPLSLWEIRKKFKDFYPPQLYILLNHKKELLKYLKEESGVF
ncbi:MAG: hypothetical protein WC788_00610 [Candidatus Paceibacterota bacterium]|jgi:predicted transcriptional regulator